LWKKKGALMGTSKGPHLEVGKKHKPPPSPPPPNPKR